MSLANMKLEKPAEMESLGDLAFALTRDGAISAEDVRKLTPDIGATEDGGTIEAVPYGLLPEEIKALVDRVRREVNGEQVHRAVLALRRQMSE